MATFIIGGIAYVAPVLNLKAVRTVWPYIQAVINSEDDMTGIFDALSEIVSAALARTHTPLTVDEVDERLLAPELQELQKAVQELFIESELIKRTAPEPGEDPAASPSTEIGTESSQSLSPPDAVAETGTA